MARLCLEADDGNDDADDDDDDADADDDHLRVSCYHIKQEKVCGLLRCVMWLLMHVLRVA